MYIFIHIWIRYQMFYLTLSKVSNNLLWFLRLWKKKKGSAQPPPPSHPATKEQKGNKCHGLRLFYPLKQTRQWNKKNGSSLPWTHGAIYESKQTYNLISLCVFGCSVPCKKKKEAFPWQNGKKSTNKIGKVLMDFMYRGCIMPRVKKAKWNFALNMQNPGCLLNDNGSAPCRWVADYVGCASKACWLTLKRPCVSWLWAF